MTKVMGTGEFMRRRGIINRLPFNKAGRAEAIAQLVDTAGARVLLKGGNLIGWEMADGKIACRKRRWSVRQAAVDKLIAIHSEPTADDAPTHVYECSLCKGFHLSRNETITQGPT